MLREDGVPSDDLDNHARLEEGVERIELDGPFATDTRGRTLTADPRQEWVLAEVVDDQRFVVVGVTEQVAFFRAIERNAPAAMQRVAGGSGIRRPWRRS